MKKQIKQYRQGDVLVERVESVTIETAEPRENGSVILAHGEVTGHAHAIAAPNVRKSKFVQSGGLLASDLEIREAVALLQHEEHATIELPHGDYRVIRQREYSPEEIRNVAD